ncbi:MAG: HAD family hydrolase [Gammaproteobacteria bacterium]|jgi:putative hydrolase of the HAD superfamily
MPSYRAICCDLFNTLVSVGEVPLSVGRYTADVLGVDTEVWNEACFGPDHEICRPTSHAEVIRVLAHSIDPEIPQDCIDQATRERQARFDHALANVRSTILQTLAQLQQRGLRLALISNASSAEVAAWPGSPLASLFELSLFSCDCGYKKPDLPIYQLALEAFAVDPGECLYVGDGGSHEFKGASQAGMRTVLTREFLKPQRYQRVLAEQAGMINDEIGCLRELLAIVSG